MNLDISTGRSRKETSWKTVPTTWARLVKKLSTPVRTYETVKQYRVIPIEKSIPLAHNGALEHFRSMLKVKYQTTDVRFEYEEEEV